MSEVVFEGRPAEYDLHLVRGDTWTQAFLYESPEDTPVDLTGYTARLQIRANKTSTGDPLLSATSAAGLISLDGSGNIVLNVPAATTAALDFNQARYDLEITSAGGIVTTLLEGNITLIKDVTRD